MLPIEVMNQNCCNNTESNGKKSPIPELPIFPAPNDGCSSKADHGHEFDQDVEGGPTSILEGAVIEVDGCEQSEDTRWK